MIEVLLLLLSALLNGAIVFGVVRTELKYLRRDIDRAHSRLDSIIEGRKVQCG